jgi:hypothetical protein
MATAIRAPRLSVAGMLLAGAAPFSLAAGGVVTLPTAPTLTTVSQTVGGSR